MWKTHNVAFNKFDFLAARGNSPIFIHVEFLAEKQISRQVELVGGAFKLLKLPNCEGNESYKLNKRN